MKIPLLCPYQHLISSFILCMFIKHNFLKIWESLIDPRKTHIHICKHFISIYNCLGYNDVSTCLEIIIITCKSLHWPCNSNVDPINEYLNTKLSTPPFEPLHNNLHFCTYWAIKEKPIHHMDNIHNLSKHQEMINSPMANNSL